MPSRTSHFQLTLPGVLAVLAGSVQALGASLFPPSINLADLDGTDGFALNGIGQYDSSGWSVSSAGDVNGDGIDDMLIGAHYADQNGQFFSGESYVVFGGPTVGGSGAIELASLNGANGFVLHGIDAFDHSGISVSSAGDVNGDGADDILIGAPGASPAGETYVVFGGPTVGASGSINLSSLNGTDGFVINGANMYDASGASVACAGDVNGDGVEDILIGAPGGDSNGHTVAGETYVVFGKDTSVAGQFAASINLSTLNGSTGFVLNGIAGGDFSGRSVASAGDINGDGVDDLIIGANYADPGGRSDAGETYVGFGGTGVGAGGSLELSSLDGTNGFVLNGIDPSDRSGTSVSSAGDLNGDGVDDLLIGASQAELGAGEAYVVFGKNTSVAGPFASAINLSSLNGITGFVLYGIAGDFSGSSVAPAGDVNGDGFDDLIIGAYGASGFMETGATYVVFGGPGIGASGSFALASVDGVTGFVINGIALYGLCGWSVSPAGDVNGDSIDDILIGAPSAGPNDQHRAGQSYIVFGRAPIPCDGDVNGDGATNVLDFNILAGHFGSSVTPNTSGDVNGDGLVNAADFVVLAGDFGCGT